MKTLNQYLFIITFLIIGSCIKQQPEENIASEIKPYSKNPRYWQFKGQPTLLLGGTNNDNLFQSNHLEAHLDSLEAAGGNYIRNTMSDRDPGDQRAFAKMGNGKYDLNKWNDLYWQKFESLMSMTKERDIIVQVEIWDRFDHSQDFWIDDPYHPKNNINYTYDQVNLDSLYLEHAYLNRHPFFFTIPELDNNTILLGFQQAFVDKILSISSKYNHVLYCIDNETSGAEEWPIFWASYIRSKTADRDMMITEMWDPWKVNDEMHHRTYDHPESYDFIDISQNSHITGEENWENAQYVWKYISQHPRPINHTKIYGHDRGKWVADGKDGEHGKQTFFRNLLGGSASSRFHRPPNGLGLSPESIYAIKTIREVEKLVKFWDVVPQMDLLSQNEPEEAYITAKEGEKYLIYFTGTGSVQLDLSKQHGSFTAKFIDVNSAKWMDPKDLLAGDVVNLTSNIDGGSLLVLHR